jgi:nucleoside-diphosphate-sugar epimerase
MPGLESDKIFCLTRGVSRHAPILAAGFAALTSPPPSKSSHLLIAFPPGPNYVDDVARALNSWSKEGPAVLVSSVGVYLETSGGLVDETSSIDSGSPLATAESLALNQGAHVLRLAGLYSESRGPQIFWKSRGESPSWSGGLVNLIHRDDAAEVTARLLVSGLSPSAWCLSDGTPLTRAEIDQAWSTRHSSPNTRFTAPDGALGKRICSEKIRKALAWKPRWTSFLDFARNA